MLVSYHVVRKADKPEWRPVPGCPKQEFLAWWHKNQVKIRFRKAKRELTKWLEKA